MTYYNVLQLIEVFCYLCLELSCQLFQYSCLKKWHRIWSPDAWTWSMSTTKLIQQLNGYHDESPGLYMQTAVGRLHYSDIKMLDKKSKIHQYLRLGTAKRTIIDVRNLLSDCSWLLKAVQRFDVYFLNHFKPELTSTLWMRVNFKLQVQEVQNQMAQTTDGINMKQIFEVKQWR